MVGAEVGGEELKGADADMAARDSCEHRAGMSALALHPVAGRDRGERARRRDAHRRHRLRHQIFAQHRTDRRLAVTVARERSEEHTSELQSLMRNSYAVFCLKKKHIPNSTLNN